MSRMNESYHIWMSHVTYEWVMSHMNKHVINDEWETSHINALRSAVICCGNSVCGYISASGWVMSHRHEKHHISMHSKAVWFAVESRCVNTFSYVEKSRHTWMRNITYARTGKHCDLLWNLGVWQHAHTWMSHVTCEWKTSYMNVLISNATCWRPQVWLHIYMWTSIVTYKWVVSFWHAWMRTIKYEWNDRRCNLLLISGMATHSWRVWSHMNESCHICMYQQ